MTNIKCTYILFLFCIFFVHCKDAGETSFNTGIGLRVEIPMGELEDISDDKNALRLPYIGNKAVIPNLQDEELEFLILSRTLDKNEFLQTYPIAVLRLKVYDKPKSIVISMPSNSEKESFSINNFMELVSEYYFLQQNIENWYLNKQGMGNTTLISWEDEKFALSLINRKLRKER